MSEMELKQLIESTAIRTGLETRRHFDEVAGELRADMQRLETELRADIAGSRVHSEKLAAETRRELRHHFDVTVEAMRLEIGILAERIGDMATKQEVAELRFEMHESLDELRTEMRAEMRAIRAELQDVRNLIRPN
jgi:leucyl-tRNA synthetase